MLNFSLLLLYLGTFPKFLCKVIESSVDGATALSFWSVFEIVAFWDIDPKLLVLEKG